MIGTKPMPEHIYESGSNLSETLEKAVSYIRKGGVLVVPTDTVYGLICQHDMLDAIDRIYAMKDRERKKPLALFSDSWDRLGEIPLEPCLQAEKLAKRFWPGELTIVMPVKEDCRCSLNRKIGVRCPNYPLITRIIQESNSLLVNTSFNQSGEPAALKIDTTSSIYFKVDLVIDAGGLKDRAASTVVDCTTEPPTILRQGAILENEIREALD